jgi:hypothetical protein
MTVESWLAAAIADAERRGLAPLKPLLETLARSTSALRAADSTYQEAAPSEDAPDDGKGPRR